MRGLIESFSIPFVLHYVAYRNGHLQKCAPRVTAPSTPDGESASRGFREESAGSTTGSAALHSTPGEEDLLIVEGSQQGVGLKSRHGIWFSVYYTMKSRASEFRTVSFYDPPAFLGSRGLWNALSSVSPMALR